MLHSLDVGDEVMWRRDADQGSAAVLLQLAREPTPAYAASTALKPLGESSSEGGTRADDLTRSGAGKVDLLFGETACYCAARVSPTSAVEVTEAL
jgi:hypothetical protein